MEKQNVTLSVRSDLLKRAKHIAVEKGVSLSKLLSEFLEQGVREKDASDQLLKRMQRRLRRGYDLGTGGKITWTRDSLYER